MLTLYQFNSYKSSIYAGLEEIKDSQAIITVKGRKIKLSSIRDHLEINPKSPFYSELIKEGIKAINITARDLNLEIKKKYGVELDHALLLSIIACCYKDGRKIGDMAFRKMSDGEIGKEIKIFDHHSAGEGNRFIALGNMEIRKQQVMPGFPVKVFGTILKVPSVLLYFRYFGVFNDPAYDMRENETIIFY